MGEVLAGYADHTAFPVLQVAVIDTIPLLHHPSLRAHLHWPWSVGLGNGLALPATPQLRNHHKIHHRKADQAGQEALLHDTAHQPPRIQLADQQLSNPKIATFTEKDVRAKRLSAALRRNTAINQQTTHNRLIRSGRQQEASREWMETLHPWGQPSPQGPASNRERSHQHVVANQQAKG